MRSSPSCDIVRLGGGKSIGMIKEAVSTDNKLGVEYKCIVSENTCICPPPTPIKGIGKFRGVGLRWGLKMEFPTGWGGGLTKIPFHGRVGICNYTIVYRLY